MAFTQAELDAASKHGDIRSLLQREVDNGFMDARSLPANYMLGPNGQVAVKPDSWLTKYGWMLPAAAMTGGLAASFAGGSAAAAAGAGGGSSLTAPIAGLPVYGANGAAIAGAGTGAASAAGSAGAAAARAAAPKVGGMTTGDWLDIFKLGSGVFGEIYGAHTQSSAADKSAEIAAAAAKYTADLAAKSNADTLAFQRSTGENAFLNNEVARRTDYGQNLAHEHRLGYLGDLMGFPAREIPDFIPGVDPHFDIGGGSGGGSAAPAANYQPLMSALNGGQGPQAAIAAFNKSQGLPDGGSYAWRSIPEAAGGGVVEIPGGSYLSPTGPNGSWVWSAGDSGGRSPMQTGASDPRFQTAVQPTRRLLPPTANAPYLAAVQPTPLMFPQALGAYM